jgi:ring-1,2-phenylacetyl-CoA epoxidase subunit PaaE
MIEQVSGTLRELNVSAERIHGEHFTVAPDHPSSIGVATVVAPGALSSAPAKATAPAALSGAPATDSAQVTILMDGRRRTFTMRMNDDTVLDAAERAGLGLPFSCRAGVCSTCRTKVVSGEVEMAQNYALEDWELEQGYVLACQSRVKTPTLELDYDEK